MRQMNCESRRYKWTCNRCLNRLSIAALVLFLMPLLNIAVAGQTLGLRDGVGLGISLGSPTAFWVDAQIAHWHDGRIQVEGYYGAGIAKWGMGEGHGAGMRMDILLVNDNVNDALLLSPRVHYCDMTAQSNGGWVNFSPQETVSSFDLDGGMVWVHEYANWSLETSLVPGAAYAISGRDNGNNPAHGELSFQLFAKIAARF